ncbi:MAG: hypothetical protein DBX97_00830 [Collinsella tanakaei]|nr:MAG: hypothetical protein DBX97_00830 [Collinsella tanakaei]
MGHPSPKYTAEFKQRAVELYRERGCTYAELAREPGCDAGSISTGSRGRTPRARRPTGTPSRWSRNCAG